jgi:uncharacterized SAM-binding protein YcdF (DUF218 family)
MLFLHKALAALVLPPMGPLLLILIGATVVRILPRFGRAVFFLGVILTIGLALPCVADLLQWPAEAEFPPLKVTAGVEDATAIVVLGGGSVRGAAEYGGETLTSATLRRVRYAAQLARRTGLPVLVSGGVIEGGGHSEAMLMADALKVDFGVPVKWLESKSVDTEENAAGTAAILLPLGIRRVLLVTDVAHMHRALAEFQGHGLSAVPAPLDYRARHDWLWPDFIPQAGAYERSGFILHEWLGDAWTMMVKRLHA